MLFLHCRTLCVPARLTVREMDARWWQIRAVSQSTCIGARVRATSRQDLVTGCWELKGRVVTCIPSRLLKRVLNYCSCGELASWLNFIKFAFGCTVTGLCVGTGWWDDVLLWQVLVWYSHDNGPQCPQCWHSSFTLWQFTSHGCWPLFKISHWLWSLWCNACAPYRGTNHNDVVPQKQNTCTVMFHTDASLR
jgi:hypothetical protein